MASLISSSVALHASADAVSMARSCGDNWLKVSSVGVVECVMSLLCVGGGGGCVCCGGGGGGGWCGGIGDCGGGGCGVDGVGFVIAVVGVWGAVVGGVVALVVAVCGVVLWWVLVLLLLGVWLVRLSFFCCWGVCFWGCVGGLLLFFFSLVVSRRVVS